jgi:hypothetical protein
VVREERAPIAPCPPRKAEAFQNTGHDSYIPPALIAKARKGNHEGSGPLIIGFDPACLATKHDVGPMAWARPSRALRHHRWNARQLSIRIERAGHRFNFLFTESVC